MSLPKQGNISRRAAPDRILYLQTRYPPAQFVIKVDTRVVNKNRTERHL